MAVDAIFTPEAAQDLAEAYDWYERRRPGLGEEFFGCVEVCLQSIRRNPEIHAIFHENYRRALIRRFPYVLMFELEDNVAAIYAVFHTSRDPEKWRERLP